MNKQTKKQTKTKKNKNKTTKTKQTKKQKQNTGKISAHTSNPYRSVARPTSAVLVILDVWLVLPWP